MSRWCAATGVDASLTMILHRYCQMSRSPGPPSTAECLTCWILPVGSCASPVVITRKQMDSSKLRTSGPRHRQRKQFGSPLQVLCDHRAGELWWGQSPIAPDHGDCERAGDNLQDARWIGAVDERVAYKSSRPVLARISGFRGLLRQCDVKNPRHAHALEVRFWGPLYAIRR
jgi:hypothetical protein